MNALGSISIPVDLLNPGQFFACCGLFELADRRWPAAKVSAHFEPLRFLLDRCSLPVLLAEFADARFEILDRRESVASRLQIHQPFGLRLDWWRSDGGVGVPNLKTWAGKQHGPTIFGLMKQAVSHVLSLESPFDYAEAIFDSKDGKTKKKTISPFYFDSRREGTSLDLGFSPDVQDMSVEAYPVVDSLALVGLQRFRPDVDVEAYPRSFLYTAWAEPMPVSVAAATVCGAVKVRSCGSFRFTKPSRGGEYASMFSRAIRERSKNA